MPLIVLPSAGVLPPPPAQGAIEAAIMATERLMPSGCASACADIGDCLHETSSPDRFRFIAEPDLRQK